MAHGLGQEEAVKSKAKRKQLVYGLLLWQKAALEKSWGEK